MTTQRPDVPDQLRREAADTTLSLGEVVLTLIAHVRLLMTAAVLAAGGATAVLLLMDNRYTAGVAMVPESRSEGLSGQLSTLASIARISVPMGQPNQSPQFYAAVLRSRSIQYPLLRRFYASAGDSASLLDILRVKGRDIDERLWRGARLLDKRTSVTFDVRSAIIRVAVVMPDPTLAAAVATAYATELDRFNREVRQSQARARRAFVEERLGQVEVDLAAAEDALRGFLQSNREYQQSPALQFEHTRLQRALTVQQELYLDLRQQYDAAKIAEVNDLPVLSVVEPAIPPQRKSGPSRRKWLMGLVVSSVLITAGGIVLREHHERIAPGLAGVGRAIRRGRNAAAVR